MNTSTSDKKSAAAPKKAASKAPASKKTASKAVVDESTVAAVPVAEVVAAVVPAPVVAAASATTVVADVAPAMASEDADAKPQRVQRSFDEIMDECVTRAQDNVTANRTLVSSMREACKCHDRELREVVKSTRQSRKQKDGVKKPLTGFAKPCRISDQLADFLHDVAGNADVCHGMEMSRTEVTRRLNEYFVKNGLRDEADKRTILYEKDPKLVALFGGNVPKGHKLTYFNLQSALKDKFIKQPSVATQTAGSTAV